MKFVVLGDLHLDPREHRVFERAQSEIRALDPAAVVCLGDLGSGSTSGTQPSFEAARGYFEGFEAPAHTILGNHDLERVEVFASDAEVIACFCKTFGLDVPYGTIELGDALGILLSSTGFRSNRGYKHEVSIDDTQFAWLRETLEAHPNRPTIIFSHAPPLGSHLRVLQYPHLRAGNAWLNQSNGPGRFKTLLDQHPQVRLWFSGHNHLGQHYEDSASLVGRCLFVHTGVIGASSRDGARHSRVIQWDGDLDVDHGEVRVDTFDHVAHEVRSDIRFDLGTNALQRDIETPVETNSTFFAAQPLPRVASKTAAVSLGRSLFARYRDMLVEYDLELEDPVGVVEDWLGRSRVTTSETTVILRSLLGSRRISPNADGYYFQVPARNPRLLSELREAFTRHVRRWS